MSEDNPSLKKNLLRIARLIEYGAELEPMQMRMTLVELEETGPESMYRLLERL